MDTTITLLSYNVPTTALYHQANGKVERYSMTYATRIRTYFDKHQTSWDAFVQPLTYVYDIQVNNSTSEMPFSLILSNHLLNTYVTAETSPIVHLKKPTFARKTRRPTPVILVSRQVYIVTYLFTRQT